MSDLSYSPGNGKERLRAELEASRAETDKLFRIVSDEDIYYRPLPQRHRLIFYLGHVDAFDRNQMAQRGLSVPSVDRSLDALFERGIDPEPGQLPADQPADWPSLETTRQYVAKLREKIDGLWDEAGPEFQQLAVEHRWMHAETLAYQFHNMPHQQKRKPAGLAEPGKRPVLVEQRFVSIPVGRATLGRNREQGFGWDNEFAEFATEVPAFEISRFKVTNGEYLPFVREGNLAPYFWEQRDGEWFYRGMFESVPLPLDAPVYVTQEQALAFARWRGAELPTEAQYHRAAFGTPEGAEREYPWGSDAGHPSVHGNFDMQLWDPVSVTDFAGGRSAFGVAQLVGNGWEWTRTPFGPFPGFAPMPHYPGYSADFFDDKHFVLKGASPRTAALLTRRSLRNWFRPDYPYLYATFRLVHN